MRFKNIFLCLFLLVALPSGAQESMMTEISYPFLEKLIAAAKANYPKAKTFDSRVNIAKLAVQKARQDWFNILSFNYLYSPNNSTTLVNPTLLNGYQFGASTSVGNIVQKPGVIKAAREDYKIALLNQEEYNMNLETLVKQRYFAYIQQMTLLNWRTKSLGTTESALTEIKYKFGKGEETFDNYNRAMGSYSTAIQTKIEAEGAFLIAKSNLEEIIGAKLDSIK